MVILDFVSLDFPGAIITIPHKSLACYNCRYAANKESWQHIRTTS